MASPSKTSPSANTKSASRMVMAGPSGLLTQIRGKGCPLSESVGLSWSSEGLAVAHDEFAVEDGVADSTLQLAAGVRRVATSRGQPTGVHQPARLGIDHTQI